MHRYSGVEKISQHLIIMTQYRSLKRELVRAQEEIKRIQSVPLVIGQFMEAIDQKYACPLLVLRGSFTNEYIQHWYCAKLDRF
jgi:ATP-dependent 26S proteasome regulatory subunit